MVGANTRIGKRVVLSGGAVIGANCDITNGANLHGRFVIGDRCRISDYCDVGGSSSIGNRCIVGHGAEFGGVLFDKVYLYHYCEMSGVFGEATDIGAARRTSASELGSKMSSSSQSISKSFAMP